MSEHLSRLADSVPDRETGVRQPHIGTVQAPDEQVKAEVLNDGMLELGTDRAHEWMTTDTPVVSLVQYR